MGFVDTSVRPRTFNSLLCDTGCWTTGILHILQQFELAQLPLQLHIVESRLQGKFILIELPVLH